MICSVVFAMASVGCTSTPDVPRMERPAPAAWAMLPAPDL
ncbi:TPA: lysis system o-spanin lipoprotein Rz1, partial [Enterobacter hormaechei subsp. oharae]